VKDLKTGIIILALLAATTLLGAVLGWQLREPAAQPVSAVEGSAASTQQ
jgi:hypothetical protein